MKTITETKYQFTMPNGMTLTLYDKASADWLQELIDKAAKWDGIWPIEKSSEAMPPLAIESHWCEPDKRHKAWPAILCSQCKFAEVGGLA